MGRSTLPLLVLLALLPAPVRAAEGDCARAAPGRWTHPRGPASRSGRSETRAPAALGPTLWTLEAEGTLLQPPLVWDGAVFVLDGDARAARLRVLDGRDGSPIASAGVERPGAGRGAVDARRFYLVTGGTTLTEWTLEGSRLAETWRHDAGGRAGTPCVDRREIYLPTAAGLLRLRPGRTRPAWEAAGDYRGDATLFGDHVYATRRTAAGALELVAHRRADGAVAASVAVASPVPAEADPRVVVSSGMAAVRTEGDTWVLLARSLEFDKLVLERRREEALATAPLLGDDSVLGRDPGGAWVILRFTNRPRAEFLTREQRPDLVDGTAAPTVLDGTLVFGTWASRLNDNRIWWHLSERPDTAAFREGTRFAIVPLDHERILAVPRDGASLHAFGPALLGE